MFLTFGRLVDGSGQVRQTPFALITTPKLTVLVRSS